MNIILIKTGFGYLKDSSGNIVCKYELPTGEHPLTDGFTFHELENKAALEAVELYRDPKGIAAALAEAKIRAKTREFAITSLKAAGELPADFEDTI